jgi:pimeloyl-ACP methyl ester carboxylesterase
MKRLIWRLSGVVLAIVVGLSGLSAQGFRPPPSKKVDAAIMKAIGEKTARLGRSITSLRKQGLKDVFLAEVEVYRLAAERIVEFKEFFQDESAEWTLEALDRGLLRAALLAQGQTPWWFMAGFPVVRAYQSGVDDSVQPYAVTFPAAYGKDPNKRWRLDIVLHGRDIRLNEVKFLHRHNGDQAAPADQDFVRLDIYGRGNNAYRWAGERDVFDALEHFLAIERELKRGGLIDLDRIVLRGFSMGGAGTWHMGLHWPDRWCVLGPGAGFTTTHGYVPDLPEKLPPYQEACLHIYDAVDYAENAANVRAVVAYSGALDPQKKAADNIEARLKKLGIPMTHLIAPKLKHEFPEAWEKKALALYSKHAAEGRDEYPQRVKFVTYTLRYPSCHWLKVLGMERHYQKASVNAERTEAGYTIKTANVRALSLTLPVGAPQQLTVKIDGDEVAARPWLTGTAYHVYLVRRKEGWKALLPQRLLTEQLRKRQKTPGLQGPIDDAFMESFLCVRGTEKPWNKAVHDYADGALKRFQAEWAKYWRGQLPIKDDIDVTSDDIAGKHLILFGDPASNSLIAQVADGLPLQWTKESLILGGKKYAAADHLPVLIYPSPLNANRYVVLNSGHTFHAAEYEDTNAMLFPRLGDYAVLRLNPTDEDPLGTEVARAGLFDEYWRIETK